jgi:hypothetical protein
LRENGADDDFKPRPARPPVLWAVGGEKRVKVGEEVRLSPAFRAKCAVTSARRCRHRALLKLRQWRERGHLSRTIATGWKQVKKWSRSMSPFVDRARVGVLRSPSWPHSGVRQKAKNESTKTCTLVQVLAISERCVNLRLCLAAPFAKVSDGFVLSGARGCLSVSARY